MKAFTAHVTYEDGGVFITSSDGIATMTDFMVSLAQILENHGDPDREIKSVKFESIQIEV